jgi:hypothetical protein
VVRSAAHELAGTLRAVRAATQISNVEHADDRCRRPYWRRARPGRQLPEQIHPTRGLSERTGTSAVRPDGSASGARVALQDAQSSTAVFVDWLNGDVRVHMRQ